MKIKKKSGKQNNIVVKTRKSKIVYVIILLNINQLIGNYFC